MNEDAFAFNDQAFVQFKPILKEAVDDEVALASKYFRFPSNAIQAGFALDDTVLEERDRDLYFDGDSPPALLYYWMTLAASVLTTEELYPVALIIPHERRLIPIGIREFALWLCSDDAEGQPGVVLAIGIDDVITDTPKWPVTVSGVIFPVFKRLGVICKATPEVFEALRKVLPQ